MGKGPGERQENGRKKGGTPLHQRRCVFPFGAPFQSKQRLGLCSTKIHAHMLLQDLAFRELLCLSVVSAVSEC